jgi:hypothetical protein
MTRAILDQVVESVLYEGYMLYPYRPSVKNHQRWTFGCLFPRDYCETHATGDVWCLQSECLVRGAETSQVKAEVRFLHLMARIVRQLDDPLDELPDREEPASRPVQGLQVGEEWLQTWQEAEERTLDSGWHTLAALRDEPAQSEALFVARRRVEPVREKGKIVALVVREPEPLAVRTELSVQEAAPGLFKLRVCILNQSPLENAARRTREDAQMRSLVSTHAILEVEGGEFVSLIDPPENCQAAARLCRNVGVWPVLVGEEGQKDTVLCSPIILYDYPQVAPESPGNLFDGTEIDEILTLRVLSLTAEEKRKAASIDERVRGLLERTEALGRNQRMLLHGTIRGLRLTGEETAHG